MLRLLYFSIPFNSTQFKFLYTIQNNLLIQLLEKLDLRHFDSFSKKENDSLNLQ